MAATRDVRSFDYVNHPYAVVRDVLQNRAEEVFRAATQAASTRAQSVAAALRVNVAGIEIGRDVVIRVRASGERHDQALLQPVTRIEIEWEAAKAPRLFPLMHAELAVYALSPTETQLDFHGHYDPPLGALGGMIDAIVGHRIAEASVHRFLGDVAAHLRSALGG